MDLDWICRLPVSRIAADYAVLALWVYDPMLEQAIRVIDSWGFKLNSRLFNWVKTGAGGRPDGSGLHHAQGFQWSSSRRAGNPSSDLTAVSGTSAAQPHPVIGF
jgi:N6-adenosine-specific RNA methylase IME4